MADSEQVLQAVARLLSTRYPTLDINPAWLRTCVQDLCRRNASLRKGSPQQLTVAVRRALLDTDLALVVSPSYTQLSPEALRSHTGKFGDAGRGAVLVQVESMIDIGYSAASQLEIAEARRDARHIHREPSDVSAEIQASSASASDPTEADHMSDFQALENIKVYPNTVYPRRMLKLELSDGGNGGNVFAIEMQRITDLNVNTTKMGIKLLLKGPLVKDGYLLLTPLTVNVEGGHVQEKHEAALDKLINRLRAELGKAPLRTPSARSTEGASSSSTAPPSLSSTTGAKQQRGFSPDEDEFELLAAFEAGDETMAETANSAGKIKASTSPRKRASPTQKRASGTVPEGRTQNSTGKSRGQSSRAAPKQYPLDPDWRFTSVADLICEPKPDSRSDSASELASGSRRQKKPSTTLSNTRDNPIVIESSPEP